MGGEVPRGFRFYPTEEELVSFFLHHKLNGTRPEIDSVIPLVHIYDYNPADLPRTELGGEHCPAEGEQWFFFIPQKERGGRPNRLTNCGYWKATGSPADVYSSDNRVIGRKRTMVFYVGRAPYGRKTVWKMNEYKAVQPSSSATALQLREEVSLCRIYKRSKCLRAFDRRPRMVAEVTESSSSAINIDPPRSHSVDAGLINHLQDNANDAAAAHSRHQPFLDWEQLNWSDLLNNNSES